MNIEVGEYVRTKKGKIFQYGKGRAYLGKDNEIVKHSKNIIDLIEVGDILVIYLRDDKKYTIYLPIESETQLNVTKRDLNIDILKSVLTKEQYMQNCYTVKRRE